MSARAPLSWRQVHELTAAAEAYAAAAAYYVDVMVEHTEGVYNGDLRIDVLTKRAEVAEMDRGRAYEQLLAAIDRLGPAGP